MPWTEVCSMDLREEFVKLVMSQEYSLSSLCCEFGISRKTGYKWLCRFRELGRSGLIDQSRASHHHPNAVSAEIEKQIVCCRGARSQWGPLKLKSHLERIHPDIVWPAASTIGAILKRHGLTVPRKVRRRTAPYTDPFVGCEQSNTVWCADFKGWFRTGDGQRCDPFTLTDAYSRYLLRCQAVTRPDIASVWPVLVAAFREFGLPLALRTDNGAPFASTALAGLSRLSVRLLRLGIIPERIRPGHPEENGRHERMHRTLKAETAQPPQANGRLQQQAFNRFRQGFNEERSHQALQQRTPAQVYQPSPRAMPLRLPEPQYPDQFILRRVHDHGYIRFRSLEIYLSEALAGEWIGLDQQDDDRYDIYFTAMTLAELDCRTKTLTKKNYDKKKRGSR